MEGKRDFEAEETVFPALSRDKLEFFGGERFETLSFHAATGSQSALPRATNGHEATRAALPPPPEVKTPRPITVEAVSSSASLPAVSSFFFFDGLALEIRIYLHHQRLKLARTFHSSRMEVREIIREIVREIENLACDIFERGSRTVSLLRRSKIGDIVSKQ